MVKTIDTLIEDVKNLFDKGHIINEENAIPFGAEMVRTIGERLEGHMDQRGIQSLRMSNLGKPNRQLWYETHRDVGSRGEQLTPDTKIKFMFGDILEHFLIFLAIEAGHTVTDRQRKVELDGVSGSIDCIIDGVLVDVKSASSRSFQKFKDGSLAMDDPFGYIAQLAGYSAALGGIDGAFYVIDKQLGHICLLRYSSEDLKAYKIRARIHEANSIILSENPPERCYEPKPDGKSGNLILSVGCSYCQFKQECWQDSNSGKGLRTFLYSSGPRHFVEVQREPEVKEISFG